MPRPPAILSRCARVVLVLAIVVALAACGSAAASFNPAGPCPPDGRAPGAYPDLEARVPATFDGRAPERRDSGRNCSDANLATLKARGLTEVRFAGAVWSDGAPRGVTLAVFSAPGLEPAWIAEWYAATAEAGRRTTDVERTDIVVQGRPGYRIQVINGDAHQVVIVWPSPDGSLTQVVLASDVPNPRIDEAIAAFP